MGNPIEQVEMQKRLDYIDVLIKVDAENCQTCADEFPSEPDKFCKFHSELLSERERIRSLEQDHKTMQGALNFIRNLSFSASTLEDALVRFRQIQNVSHDALSTLLLK